MSRAARHAWRLVVLVVGLSVVAIGMAMIVLPGPAFIVIPVGLAILGTEFLWARRLLHSLKERGSTYVQRVSGRKPSPPKSFDAPPATPPRPAGTLPHDLSAHGNGEAITH